MTVVAGYVPTAEGRAALRRAVAEAELRGERLLVVNASRGDSYADPALVTEEEVEKLRTDLAGSGVEFEVRQCVRGRDPAAEVIGAADEVGADLVVIGLRHRTAVGKLLLGSTAQRILLEAHCAVLGVKADHDEV